MLFWSQSCLRKVIYRSDGGTYVPCMFEYVKTRNIDVMGLRYLSGVVLFHLYCVGWNICEDVRSEMLQGVKVGVYVDDLPVKLVWNIFSCNVV